MTKAERQIKRWIKELDSKAKPIRTPGFPDDISWMWKGSCR